MADSSFDVVSKVDRQEVDNALNQASKELSQRYDFRGTGAKIEWSGDETIVITTEAEERAKAALDVFKEKLIRRNISLKAFEAGEPQASGKVYKITGKLVEGITSREREEDLQDHPRRGSQVRQGSDPGRGTARQQQEARRSAGCHRAAEG